MSKSLSEMSLEELWQLFPIILTEHREEWETWYTEEKAELERILPPGTVDRISHVGSTAIGRIQAKPIVDILVEAAPGTDMGEIHQSLCENGWICMSRSENRMSFNKGYTEQGFAEKVFHLHLRYFGDNDELYFRDYLNERPDIAEKYEQLKLSLWKKYEHDREGYTEAKGMFVRKYTAAAKKKYGNRYEKRLYLIGGPMGVGKTTVGQILKRNLPGCVFLDGDWCWDMDPFQVTAETKQMVMENICTLLNNFISCTAYQNIVFCWVMHQQEILDEIISRLDAEKCRIVKISLICTEEALRERLAKDIEKGVRKEDVISRSLNYLPLYHALDTVKIDVSGKTVEKIAAEIIEKADNLCL